LRGHPIHDHNAIIGSAYPARSPVAWCFRRSRIGKKEYPGAKRTVGDVLADFGWSDAVDIGGIEGSCELEAICIAWVKVGGARGSWDHGFKLLVG